MSERIKKPEPERTEPIRNWSTMFGPPPRGSNGAAPFPMPPFPMPPFPFAAAANGAGAPAPGGGPPFPFPFPGAPGAPAPGESVARGVTSGYRVIEEYMRQGRNVARSMWGPYGGGGFGPEDPQPRWDGMAQAMSQMASVWLDMMNLAMPGMMAGYPAPPTGTAGPFHMGREHDRSAQPDGHDTHGATHAHAPVDRGSPHRADPRAAHSAPEAPGQEQTSVVIEVASPQPTEVSLDLKPRSLGLSLRVHDLRAPEADKPRLADVTVGADADGERVRVRVRVPADQPPGVYSGVILDERTSLPRGTLTVRVG